MVYQTSYHWNSSARRRAIRRRRRRSLNRSQLATIVQFRLFYRFISFFLLYPTTRIYFIFIVLGIVNNFAFFLIFFFCRKAIQGEIKIQAENGETRVLRSAPDWTVNIIFLFFPFVFFILNLFLLIYLWINVIKQESAITGDHLWVSTNASGSDLCYVGENQCSVNRFICFLCVFRVWFEIPECFFFGFCANLEIIMLFFY